MRIGPILLPVYTVYSRAVQSIAFISRILSDLIWYDLWSECAMIGRSHGEAGRFTAHDPLCRGCDQSQRRALNSDEMRSSEMRWVIGAFLWRFSRLYVASASKAEITDSSNFHQDTLRRHLANIINRASVTYGFRSGSPEKSSRSFLAKVGLTLRNILWKFVHNFSHKPANRQANRQTDRQTDRHMVLVGTR